jgi:RES domain-containing protein
MSDETRSYPQLDHLTGSSYESRCFRVVDLESYTGAKSPTLLFDLGPKISKGGQRFSPPDDHRGLYVSAELPTAGAEFADGSDHWTKGDCTNHVVFNMDVRLCSVLDLTDARVRRTLKISKATVQSAWEGFADLNEGEWPPTWNLGHEVFASRRFDGILFPSTKRSTGTCLLILTERLVKGTSGVTILKQNGSAWERLP